MTFTWWRDTTGEYNTLYIKNHTRPVDEVAIWPVNKLTVDEFERHVNEAVSLLNVQRIKRQSDTAFEEWGEKQW